MKEVRSVTAPMKFFINKNIFSKLPEHTKSLGEKPYIIADPFIYERAVDELGQAYRDSKIAEFGGENSSQEIDKHKSGFETSQADFIIGIGGGKTLDNAKATAYYADTRVVIVPTLASTDAPATSLSVIYTEEGEFDHYLFLPNNPDIVIADLNILAAAPARAFASGMADAMATWIEGRTSFLTDGVNLSEHRASFSGYGIAKMSYDTVREYGIQALEAVKNNLATSAVGKVVEATVWMSGVGAEAVGLTATHAIHNGMTQLSYFNRAQHGEIVGFAMIANLILEGATDAEIYDLAQFNKQIGLLLTLEDLGLTEWKEDEWRMVAEAACSKEDTMSNMSILVEPDDVYQAIQQADHIMQSVKDGYVYKG